jgi:hypothetical protein
VNDLGHAERRHIDDRVVAIAGRWYVRMATETVGPLNSEAQASAYLDLLDAVAAARGLESQPSHL